MWKTIGNKLVNLFKDNLHWIFIATMQAVLILLCVNDIPEREIIKQYFNTDYLYLPSLYRDVFINGNSIMEWFLTPSPYFFPDMLLYFIIYAIVPNLTYTTLIFAFVQLLLIEYFFYKILKLLLNDTSKARLLIVFSSIFIQLFLLAGAINKEYFAAQLVLTNSAHLGSVLTSLIAIFLFSSYSLTLKNKYLIWLGFIVILSIISDRIFIIQTVVPLVGMSIYLLLAKKQFKLLITMLVSTLVGWYLFKLIQHNIVNIPNAIDAPISKNQSILNFIDSFNFMVKYFKIASLAIYLHLIAILLSPLGFFFSPKEKRHIYVVFIFSGIISFVFPIIMGFIQSLDTYRYIMHSYFFFLMLMPIYFNFALKRVLIKKLFVFIFIGYACFVFFYGFNKLYASKLSSFFYFKPSALELFRENDHVLKNGVTNDYWLTKSFYMFGGFKHRVVPIKDDSVSFFHEVNKQWYIDDNKNNYPIFNFSINTKLPFVSEQPLDSVVFEIYTLYMYKDFYFKKSQDNQFIITTKK